jgi:hypothetical protein
MKSMTLPFDEDMDEPHPEALAPPPRRPGEVDHPPHYADEDRRRAEFTLLSGPAAKRRARRRLVEFLIDHPGVIPVLRQERR